MPAFHSSLPVVCFSAFRRLRSLVSRGLLSRRRAPRVVSCRRRCTRSRWPTSRSACRWPRLASPVRSAKSGVPVAPRGRFARPGWFRTGGAVRGAGGRRAEAPAGGRDSLGPLGRPSRVFPKLRADGFEAAGTLSDRHHVYGVMFTAYLAPRGCGDWDTPFAYPPGVPHESQA